MAQVWNRTTIRHTLGKTVVDKATAVAFQLGTVSYTRGEIASLMQPLPSWHGMRRLERYCQQEGITSVSALSRVGATTLAQVRGIGEITVWAVACLLAAHEKNVERFFAHGTDPVVTWRTRRKQQR